MSRSGRLVYLSGLESDILSLLVPITQEFSNARMRLNTTLKNFVRLLSVCSLLTFCCVYTFNRAVAQSTDIALPTPVQTNEARGTIAPRDLGDPRLTDHFFAFTGTPGDLLITVDSQNMNGDVDVFTSTGLRPLLKFTVYAGSSSPVTKSIYLRKREDLLLRVEARTPNDEEATYRLHFGGAFEPITSGPLVEAAQNASTQPTLSSTGTGRRVTAVGARVYEPPTEIAAAPTPEPTPESPPAEVKPTPTEEPAVSAAPGRPPRGRRGRRRPAVTAPSAPSSTAETTTTPIPTQEPEVQTGPRLLIETDDGTLINRYMSDLRRVIVENGQVVIVGKNGRILRIPLASVVKMSIAPE